MTFDEYCEIVFCTMEYYCELHLDPISNLVWLDRTYNWIDEVYRPIWESLNEMVKAQTPEALVTVVQWVSHLNHTCGNLMRDYRVDRRYEHKIVDSLDKLNQMEQEGLDAAFPNWESEIKNVIGTFKIRCPYIESPEVLLDYVSEEILMNKLRCGCGHTLCLGDSCHECRQAVPATFYDYYLLVIEGLSQFQMWHTPIETHIVMEVVNVIQNINEARSAFDILAATAMANHLLHYNGRMITDYFACPDGFIDELSNGFEYVWDDVESDAQEIFECECLRVYIRKPWLKFFNE